MNVAIGDEHWPDMVPECGGKHQSPINIVYSQALFDEALPDIDVVHPEDGAHATSIVNNGHTRT